MVLQSYNSLLEPLLPAGADLLVRRLQHRAAARIEGRGALGLHLGGEGGLVSCLALDVVHLVMVTQSELVRV